MIVYYYPREGDPLTFGTDSLVQVTIRQQADLFFGALPQLELQVQLCTSVPITPQREEQLRIYWNQDKELRGHIKEVTRISEHVYSLVARARPQSMETRFIGGFYDGASFFDITSQLLPQLSYGVDSGVSSHPVTGYIPCTNRARVLQDLALSACGCMIWDQDDRLYFRCLWEQPLRTVAPDRVVAAMDISYLPLYSHYEVGVHSYTPGTRPVTLKKDEEVTPSTTTFTYPRPYVDYGLDESYGGEILDFGPNFLTLIHGNMLSIYAIPYIHDVAYRSRTGEGEGYTNKMTVWENTLIQSHNADRVLEHMQRLGQLRQRLTCRVLVKAEEDLPWVGDYLEIPTPWGTKFQGYVSEFTGRCAREDVQMELTLCGKETQ